MTIEELIKSMPDVRLEGNNKWIVFDFYNKSWEVYTHEKYARHSKCLIKTDELDEALDVFCK